MLAADYHNPAGSKKFGRFFFDMKTIALKLAIEE
jgi:hypothetical protein